MFRNIKDVGANGSSHVGKALWVAEHSGYIENGYPSRHYDHGSLKLSKPHNILLTKKTRLKIHDSLSGKTQVTSYKISMPKCPEKALPRETNSQG